MYSTLKDCNLKKKLKTVDTKQNWKLNAFELKPTVAYIQTTCYRVKGENIQFILWHLYALGLSLVLQAFNSISVFVYYTLGVFPELKDWTQQNVE